MCSTDYVVDKLYPETLKHFEQIFKKNIKKCCSHGPEVHFLKQYEDLNNCDFLIQVFCDQCNIFVEPTLITKKDFINKLLAELKFSHAYYTWTYKLTYRI
jgi:hypothetical protein